MTIFDQINEEINKGIKGLNNGIPMGFERLNKHIGIRKRIYTLIIGPTGSGKSSLFHDAYILNPYDWWVKNKNKTTLKFEAVIFNMERSRIYTVTKWISRKIFVEHGELIPVAKILGWWDQKITKDEHDYVIAYKDYINEMLESNIVQLIDGARTPGEIAHYIKDYAEKRGTIEEIDKHTKVYHPENENLVSIIGLDHAGLVKLSKEFPSKKEAIDQTSGILQKARDFYGFSPVVVSQLNRNVTNPSLLKSGFVEPILDNVKETGRLPEDCDVAISVFDPIRFDIQKAITTDELGYQPYQLRDESNGAKYYRRIKILKNTYGADQVGLGVAFLGSTGQFKELPKSQEMDPTIYESVLNQSFFRQHEQKPRSRIYY